MGALLSYVLGQSVTVSGNRYSVVRRIGEGGFSYVYLVRQGGKKYALKRMLMQIQEQELAAEKEIEAHGLVKHPNVIPLLAYDIRPEGLHKRSRGASGVSVLLARNGAGSDREVVSSGRGENLGAVSECLLWCSSFP